MSQSSSARWRGGRALVSAKALWPVAKRAARAVEVRLISYTPRSSIWRSVQMRITVSSAFPASPPVHVPKARRFISDPNLPATMVENLKNDKLLSHKLLENVSPDWPCQPYTKY